MRVIALIRWRREYRQRRPDEPSWEELAVDCLALVTGGLLLIWMLQ